MPPAPFSLVQLTLSFILLWLLASLPPIYCVLQLPYLAVSFCFLWRFRHGQLVSYLGKILIKLTITQNLLLSSSGPPCTRVNPTLEECNQNTERMVHNPGPQFVHFKRRTWLLSGNISPNSPHGIATQEGKPQQECSFGSKEKEWDNLKGSTVSSYIQLLFPIPWNRTVPLMESHQSPAF